MRVTDLLPDHDLVLHCQNPDGCGHSARMTRGEAIERLGAETLMATIRTRSRFTACGWRGVATVVMFVGRTGSAG